MLAEGGPPYLGPAARMLLEALDWYWVRAGPELALGLVEVVEDVGGEAAEGEDGAKKQQRAWGNHAELHLAEYLLQRGARRVDIGTPLGKGLCWLCEMWFKGLMKVAAPELVVRTWNYSGVCRKEWRMPRWWRIRRAEDGEEREIQSLVIKFVEDAVVEYIAKAKRMLREKSEDDDEDSDEDEDEDDEDEDGEDESDASSVYEDHEEDGANRVRSLED